ncbi:MAG: hypothetical protein IT572_07225 [Deltaproteobacteria bacterium]|nr:hypothetical protein [Deltaproteobacteria bacterium]
MAIRELGENRGSSEPKKPIEIEDLVSRLQDLCPEEMAKALFTLEFHKKFSQAFQGYHAAMQQDPTSLFFSRGLKHEIQTIYLELARHLKAKNAGATELMNQVFDFFGATLKSLLKVPNLVSNN